jgi:hypothetical protein
MAQLFCDSFSIYATADLPTRYPGGAAFASGIVTTELPPNAQAGAHVLQIGGFQGPTALSTNLGAQGRMIQGQRFWRIPTTYGYILQFCSPNPPFTNLVAGLWLDITGTYVKNSANAIVGTGGTINDSEWHHWEFDVNFATGAFAVYLDGNPAPFITGTDASLISTVVSFFAVGVGSYSGAPPQAQSAGGYVADLYVFNGVGSDATFNAPLAPQGLGAAKMAFSVPNGPGTVSAWTPNGAATDWQCIDQIPQDGDTTYASSATVGQQYMCTFAALPPMQTLISVQLSSYARTDDAGPRAYQSGFWKGGTFGFSGVNEYLGGTYNYIEDEYMINPITGLPWAVADLTGLQFGAELTV